MSRLVTALVLAFGVASASSCKKDKTESDKTPPETDNATKVDAPPKPEEPPAPAAKVAILNADHGGPLWVFPESKDKLGTGGELHVYIDPEEFPGALASFARYGVGVGGALPVHRHDRTEEIAYFVSGEGKVTHFEGGKEKSVPVKAGNVWYTPPGAWHGMTNTGKEPLVLVFAVIPNEKKGLLSFFRRIAVTPGNEGEQLSPEDFARIAAEHDLLLRPPKDAEPGGSRALKVMSDKDADKLWAFAKSKDELGSGGEFHIYMDPAKTPEALASFAKFGLGPEGMLPIHRHDKTEEIAYFISGTGAVISYEGDKQQETEVSAGNVWYTPPGAWHGLKNTGEEPLVLVFATIPNEKKGLLTFFREISAKPGTEAKKLAPEDFAKIASEHDMILRPPE